MRKRDSFSVKVHYLPEMYKLKMVPKKMKNFNCKFFSFYNFINVIYY